MNERFLALALMIVLLAGIVFYNSGSRVEMVEMVEADLPGVTFTPTPNLVKTDTHEEVSSNRVPTLSPTAEGEKGIDDIIRVLKVVWEKISYFCGVGGSNLAFYSGGQEISLSEYLKRELGEEWRIFAQRLEMGNFLEAMGMIEALSKGNGEIERLAREIVRCWQPSDSPTPTRTPIPSSRLAAKGSGTPPPQSQARKPTPPLTPLVPTVSPTIAKGSYLASNTGGGNDNDVDRGVPRLPTLEDLAKWIGNSTRKYATVVTIYGNGSALYMRADGFWAIGPLVPGANVGDRVYVEGCAGCQRFGAFWIASMDDEGSWSLEPKGTPTPVGQP